MNIVREGDDEMSAYSTPPTIPVTTTNIYPTRYAAFDTPSTLVVFEPTDDGMMRHCRNDNPYVPVSGFFIGKHVGEITIYMDDDFYLEVMGRGVGQYQIKAQSYGLKVGYREVLGSKDQAVQEAVEMIEALKDRHSGVAVSVSNESYVYKRGCA